MADYDEIVGAVLEIVAQYRTRMTLRQIYYRLVAKNLIPNNLNSYKGLSRTLVTARERGEVDDDIMEDRGREVYGGDSGYDSPEEFVRGKVEGLDGCWSYYTRELWVDQPEYVEVWVEKDALSRLFRSAVDGLRVTTCVGRGYSSYTYVKRAVDRFAAIPSGKPCTIIYAGDWDPSGLDITRDLGRRLKEYGAPQVKVHRIALTKNQISEYELPPAPVKTTDARAGKFIAKHGHDVVELDALEPNVLQGIVRGAVEKHIDADAWEATRQRIAAEREIVREKMQPILEAIRAATGGDE
jgi:hypothetical protein